MERPVYGTVALTVGLLQKDWGEWIRKNTEMKLSISTVDLSVTLSCGHTHTM